ncbi:hypothetical protein [Bombiscardovia coagulans]|uniref:Uncharacterized protein n=1 Tax=Bombiscardovia coagulans TaxID=686666 RepID=A0A261ESM9_9BIFI|nr:hypothetical protein [Bombiscardovia coagulans]OZG49863.1 hypothetical protein BOCO_0380 [Bombiscardovia coagulans]
MSKMREPARKPAGSPGGVGGQFDVMVGKHCADLPVLDEVNTRARIQEPEVQLSAQETLELLKGTQSVIIRGTGLELVDENGQILYVEAQGYPRLNAQVLRADKNVRMAVRDTLNADLTGIPSEAYRQRIVKQAFRLASPYQRRNAIESSPNRRYIPASHIVNSLRHRKNQDQAVTILKDLFYEDAEAAQNVIRAGYPNTADSAWAFINYTKDARDAAGHVITERRKVYKRDQKGRFLRDSTGQKIPVVKTLAKRESKGAAARSYLRMLYQPTNGVPDRKTTRQITEALHELDNEPHIQAQAFWELCYGNGTVRNRTGNTKYAKSLVNSRAFTSKDRGITKLEAYSSGSGQGNVARMVAYHRALTPEAAKCFLELEPGDKRLAHTIWTRRTYNKQTGKMETVTPKRLTEMRSWIKAVYTDL